VTGKRARSRSASKSFGSIGKMTLTMCLKIVTWQTRRPRSCVLTRAGSASSARRTRRRRSTKNGARPAGCLADTDSGGCVREDIQRSRLPGRRHTDQGERDTDRVYPQESFPKRIANWDKLARHVPPEFPTSITYNKKSYEVIREKLPVSMRLASSLSSSPTRCASCWGEQGGQERDGVRLGHQRSCLIGYGIPGFVLAVFLIKAFGPGSDSWLHAIPLKGIQSRRISMPR